MDVRQSIAALVSIVADNVLVDTTFTPPGPIPTALLEDPQAYVQSLENSTDPVACHAIREELRLCWDDHQRWALLRDGGIIWAAARLIKPLGKNLDSQDILYFVISLHTCVLCYTILGKHEKEERFEPWVSASHVYKASVKVLENIWTALQVLTPSDGCLPQPRESVCSVTCNYFIILLTLRSRNAQDDMTPELWGELMFSIFNAVWTPRQYIECMGQDGFLDCVCDLLADDRLVNTGLNLFLDGLCGLYGDDGCLDKATIQVPDDLAIALIKAMWRQLQQNTVSSPETWQCAYYVDQLISIVLDKSCHPEVILRKILLNEQETIIKQPVFMVDNVIRYIPHDWRGVHLLICDAFQFPWPKMLNHLETKNPIVCGLVRGIRDEWRRLGSKFNIPMEDCQAARLLGCCWHRCPLYQEPTDKWMYICACGDARYCNAECQASDWREGGHRDTCTHRKERKRP
ncbi:hypothetical protein OE88DRAFT_1646781 [Heliocybe sulcata]|uniref:MYND-type domain-containing protein n=1 Tax=Heliocybe sulcata TaxID=5364 RepID=A0A5C3MY06_9AGAM|nr:hypothetical protein OE88DRAFT_1646781 [Heliocybe sulcata]